MAYFVRVGSTSPPGPALTIDRVEDETLAVEMVRVVEETRSASWGTVLPVPEMLFVTVVQIPVARSSVFSKRYLWPLTLVKLIMKLVPAGTIDWMRKKKIKGGDAEFDDTIQLREIDPASKTVPKTEALPHQAMEREEIRARIEPGQRDLTLRIGAPS